MFIAHDCKLRSCLINSVSLIKESEFFLWVPCSLLIRWSRVRVPAPSLSFPYVMNGICRDHLSNIGRARFRVELSGTFPITFLGSFAHASPKFDIPRYRKLSSGQARSTIFGRDSLHGSLLDGDGDPKHNAIIAELLRREAEQTMTELRSR